VDYDCVFEFEAFDKKGTTYTSSCNNTARVSHPILDMPQCVNKVLAFVYTSRLQRRPHSRKHFWPAPLNRIQMLS
jgi:hypothetical protein